jgi:hypothetical protein
VPYRVVILRAARDQLRGAPPLLLGYVVGFWVLEERQLVAVEHVTWLG